MGILSEDIDELTGGLTAEVEVRMVNPKFLERTYGLTAKQMENAIRKVMSEIPIDDINDDQVLFTFKKLFRTRPLANPNQLCHHFKLTPLGDNGRFTDQPNCYEIMYKRSKYAKTAGFIICFK